MTTITNLENSGRVLNGEFPLPFQRVKVPQLRCVLRTGDHIATGMVDGNALNGINVTLYMGDMGE